MAAEVMSNLPKLAQYFRRNTSDSSGAISDPRVVVVAAAAVSVDAYATLTSIEKLKGSSDKP